MSFEFWLTIPVSEETLSLNADFQIFVLDFQLQTFFAK